MGVPEAKIKVDSQGEQEATGDASRDRKIEVEFQTASLEGTEENAG